MTGKKAPRGFTLVEIMVSTTIFSLALVVIFASMGGIQNTLDLQSSKNTVAGNATRLMDRLGMDIRESSYAYIFAGDWYAVRGATVEIRVARNYFSSNPLLGGGTLVPGIANEGWAQCPNPVCTWSTRLLPGGTVPFEPNAYLSQPIRNNAQVTTPFFPPPSLQFNTGDAKGRLFSHLSPNDSCPLCGSQLSSVAYFSGMVLFSPRRQDGTFAYNDEGDAPRWESMVFYCPFRTAQGRCELRRYVFYASSVNVNASLEDFMDFDGNEIIESPPMTDGSGNFVLDADGEIFSLNPGAGSNSMLYTRWDNTAVRSFTIDVNRVTGMASVTVVGGPFGGAGTQQIPLFMERFASGLSDFEASTYINNPSWDWMGATINPTGVAETGSVRISFQIDRADPTDINQVETVQTTQFRPRN